MAIAGQWQAATFNKPDYTLFDYDIYAICGDGCLMEGISAEAASLAGHLKLSNLCWIYDSNQITIEGSTELAFTEDVATRFEGYGWAVQHVDDANDLDALTAALEAFKAETGQADDDHRQERDRAGARRPRRGTTPPTVSRSAWRRSRGRSGSTAGPRTSRSWCPKRSASTSPRSAGSAGAEAREAWDELFAAYGKEYPGARGAAGQHAAAPAARRLGR